MGEVANDLVGDVHWDLVGAGHAHLGIAEHLDQVLQQGRLLVHNWDEYAFFENKARFETDSLAAELVERKWREAYRRFYLRPHRIARTLVRKRTWRELPRTTRMAWKTLMSG